VNAEKRIDDYARQDVNETLAGLEWVPPGGLSNAEVRQRLTRYGYKEIEEKDEPLWHRVFRRFRRPIDPLDDRTGGAALVRGAEAG